MKTIFCRAFHGEQNFLNITIKVELRVRTSFVLFLASPKKKKDVGMSNEENTQAPFLQLTSFKFCPRQYHIARSTQQKRNVYEKAHFNLNCNQKLLTKSLPVFGFGSHYKCFVFSKERKTKKFIGKRKQKERRSKMALLFLLCVVQRSFVILCSLCWKLVNSISP